MKEYYKISAETYRAVALFFASIDAGLSVFIYNDSNYKILPLFALFVCVFATILFIILYYDNMEKLKQEFELQKHKT